ncbi:hypothetical protein CQA53_03395 [Helicobacter didelphidarum]|uniref:Uncharacterized protein n=1 Tax=Helicobacter didelphidarum TaxID=2040648 RepID=A0A3D8IN16_9HELI|nr:DUF3226 domain-containing protein [Helicobacter didelphidarum]RDU66503.1 hypothetical protein CQA53_03395 [Helicobacter didelphidarum]
MLIIVEGNTDKSFIELYCKYLGVEIKENSIKSAGGKDGLKSIKSIEKYNKIKIIFDADNDIALAKANIEKQIQEISKNISQYEIFLFPNNQDSGNLEILLENMAKEKCILECFTKYEECLRKLQKDNSNLKLPAKKSKVYAYFHSFGFKNGNKNFEINNDILNLDSDYLIPLKEFLEK